jgi:hypothetical protein
MALGSPTLVSEIRDRASAPDALRGTRRCERPPVGMHRVASRSRRRCRRSSSLRRFPSPSTPSRRPTTRAERSATTSSSMPRAMPTSATRSGRSRTSRRMGQRRADPDVPVTRHAEPPVRAQLGSALKTWGASSWLVDLTPSSRFASCAHVARASRAVRSGISGSAHPRPA